ncbi:MAG: succinylglutamate desuccinylase/aspartoacylase family protein [Polyangiales bacterium]
MSDETPIVMRELDIEALPVSKKSRVLVEIVTDGLGQRISVPVLVARGRKPGPVVGITAALHGNELNGIPVIHGLFNALASRPIQGTVVAVVVTNVPGYHAHRREFNDGTDLNDVFPGREDGNTSQVYAHRLMSRIISRFSCLLDLHTASFGRINSLYVRADMKNSATARMAYLQRPQIILHNPPSDGTLRGAAMDLGIPAITVEIADPQRFQYRQIKAAINGILSVLADQGVVRRGLGKPASDPILCSTSRWLFADRGGLLDVNPHLGERVQKGETIAFIHNAFGDLVRTYTAPFDGIVIGKSVNPVGQTGARILHLGTVVDSRAPEWETSTLLRRSLWPIGDETESP